MSSEAHWIIGSSRSGKTTRLLEYVSQFRVVDSDVLIAPVKPLLILAATGDNRLDLDDRLAAFRTASDRKGQTETETTTPLGFCLHQVSLFWPQLISQLETPSQFPIRLRPETEQELATRLWQPELQGGRLRAEGVPESRLVRQVLDIWALAAASGVGIAEIPTILAEGELGIFTPGATLCGVIGEVLERWRQWCLSYGLLTYGLGLDLYGQWLLGDRRYQDYLTQHYCGVCADDVDEYPALMRPLLELFLDRGLPGYFTYNPEGGIRVGLNADPQYLAELAQRCVVESLGEKRFQGLAVQLSTPCIELVLNPLFAETSWEAPEQIQSIQTISRSQLLREVANTIIDAIRQGKIEPQEIAIIAPGLDDIARYTLIHLLEAAHIPLRPLNEQRPLAASPLIRSLLTLIVLVYPGLGRLIHREAIAEMLILLSHPLLGLTSPNQPPPYWIDPVRAGLIADHCYVPDPHHPHLLPIQAFPRWDRLGYRASTAYTQICAWIRDQKQDLQERLLSSPPIFLDRAINRFFLPYALPYDQLAAIRELMETAHHYWTVDRRLHPNGSPLPHFIQLLRQGTITANPYPVRTSNPKHNAVTLATIFQYRSHRHSHRWHFWLDASSPLWLKGGAASLLAAPLFLRHRLRTASDLKGKPGTVDESFETDQERLRRILLDLLSRVEERLYLCHSDLAVNGVEQTGPLFSLVSASRIRNEGGKWGLNDEVLSGKGDVTQVIQGG